MIQKSKPKPSAQPRLPATVVRGKKYGLANQLAHEAQGRADRAALKKKLDDSHAEARAKGAKKIPKVDPSGMSGGVMGSTLRASFSGMSRDKGRSARRIGY